MNGDGWGGSPLWPIIMLMRTWEQERSFFENGGPPMYQSASWDYWHTEIDGKQCVICKAMHGTITDRAGTIIPKYNGTPVWPPVHPNCRCEILPLPAMRAGTATILGMDGAD